MNISNVSCCVRCCFYHGDNGLVCAIHPYGPASDVCSDFAPRVNGLDKVKRVIDNQAFLPFRNWNSWAKVMVISLLLAFVGYSFVLRRIRTFSPPTPTTKAEFSLGQNASNPSGTNNFKLSNQDP